MLVILIFICISLMAKDVGHLKELLLTICGSLNVIGPHKLIESSNMRRHDLVGVAMALLEGASHCGGRPLLFSNFVPCRVSHFLFPFSQDVGC